jgi:hypothetical protein
MTLPDGFSQLPEPVAVWLEDMVTRYGPPDEGREWSNLLRGRSLDVWRALHWEKRAVVLAPGILTDASWKVIHQLVAANCGAAQNAYSSEEWQADSASKFADIYPFLIAHHSLPGNLIFLDADGLLEVVDGCHRLALFFMESQDGVAFKPEHNVWVGEEGLHALPRSV